LYTFNSFLPDDRALSVFCPAITPAPVAPSVFASLQGLSDEAITEVHARNDERCRYLTGAGLADVAPAADMVSSRQDGFWRCSGRQRTTGWKGASYEFKGHGLLDEIYLAFVGEHLFHAFRPDNDGKLFSLYLGFPAAEPVQMTIFSRSGILRTEAGDDWMETLPQVPQLDNEAKLIDLRRRITAQDYLGKKGILAGSPLKSTRKKRLLQQLFQKVNGALQDRFSYNVFACHGTLLGLTRNGDLIPNDDDFDCAYLSAHKNCADVARERGLIFEALRGVGSRQDYGPTGHIRIRQDDVEIDLMPAWFDDDCFNVSSYTSIPLPREAILPLSRIVWLDGSILVPAEPERFLEANYGPGWRVPDPFSRSKPNDRALAHRRILQSGMPGSG
jgi:hypothetical protein